MGGIGFLLVWILAGLAVPVLVVYFLVRLALGARRHDQSRKSLTPDQLKRMAAGTAIAILVPAFLYQLASYIGDPTGAVSYDFGDGGGYLGTTVIVGSALALMAGVALRHNRTVSFGLGAGGLLGLIVEFIVNFESISPPIRVVTIGFLLAVLIAYTVKKTLDHAKIESLSSPQTPPLGQQPPDAAAPAGITKEQNEQV